jgi:hypothetical protein
LEVAYTYPAIYTASLSEESNFNKGFMDKVINLKLKRIYFSFPKISAFLEVV